MDILCHAQLHFAVELQIYIDISFYDLPVSWFKRNPNTIPVSKIIWYKYENYRIEVRWYRAGVFACDILVPHIDSRGNIIDNERPGASPCDLLLVIPFATDVTKNSPWCVFVLFYFLQNLRG
jgi:hypothetical protein